MTQLSTPHLGATPTPALGATARKKAQKSKTGRAHAKVSPSRWSSPAAKKSSESLPLLAYNRGPFTLTVPNYNWRLFAIRGDGRAGLITEVETFTWEDASAVMTGSVTFHTPDWQKSLNLKEGHKIRAYFSEDGGANFTPVWTMRIVQPNADLVARTRSANLVSDLNRLVQSNDDFVYVKGKDHPGGWRVDQVIRDICTRYGIEVAYLPKMATRIKDWHLTDQRPLDVIHSALMREKTHTGNRYAPSFDWRERLWVTTFRRPTHLFEIGPQLLAATGTATLDPRFATAITMKTGYNVKVRLDKGGHRKVHWKKLAVDVPSRAGITLYGLIHRNVYSPDAASNSDARREGKLYIAAVGKVQRSYTVTLPGLAFVKRLDAFKVVLPEDNISQIVYVSDARHTVDAGSGYTTDIDLDFDDPFLDNKRAKILQKISDVAVGRRRVTKPKPKPKPKKTKVAQARSKQPTGAKLGSTFTRATTTRK